MIEFKNVVITGKNNTVLLNNISLTLQKGEHIAITGASGSGKTTLIKAIMGVYGNELVVKNGDILLDEQNLLKLSKKVRRSLCGTTFGFIPQNPMTAFFQNVKIGKQMADTIEVKLNRSKKDAINLIRQSLKQVNLTDIDRVMSAYPSELSGGMLERVTVAILIALNPQYILADEPTSLLDAENRKILIELLKEFTQTGILFVSHDDEAIKSLCSQVIILSKGEIIEKQTTENLFSLPEQDWTKLFVKTANLRIGGDTYWKKSNW